MAMPSANGSLAESLPAPLTTPLVVVTGVVVPGLARQGLSERNLTEEAITMWAEAGDVLSPDAAVTLLAKLAGHRVTAQPAAAARVAALCGCHPIVLALAARRLASHPQWTMTDMVSRVDAEARRLPSLPLGPGVHAVFMLSYHALPAPHRRIFRLLGLHPDAEMETGSVAALAGVSTRDAAAGLTALAGESLLERLPSGRYRMHPLLRAYARDRAEADETVRERTAADQRMRLWTADHAPASSPRAGTHAAGAGDMRPARGADGARTGRPNPADTGGSGSRHRSGGTGGGGGAGGAGGQAGSWLP
jgi:uncharacterized membrane protein YgcG